MLEFYSEMCGSCKEFEPTWAKLAARIKRMHLGRVNIDTAGGKRLARRLGVLDGGIPAVYIEHQAGGAGVVAVQGDMPKLLGVMKKINPFVKDLDKREETAGGSGRGFLARGSASPSRTGRPAR